MAKAKPVHSAPSVAEDEAVVATPVVRNDPRRPNSEAEAPVSKPKEVKVLGNGTTIEDY